MIQANELRVGNLVCFTNNRTKEIHNHVLLLKDFGKSFLNKVEPIHLTPEILEKAGFVKISDRNFYHWTLKFSGIADNGSNKYIISGMHHKDSLPIVVAFTVNGFWASKNMEYLHQLQNLYFALTGEELQINFNEPAATS
jgi:hypothetical protein